MNLTHQDVLDYKKRFEGCEYVELSHEEFDVLLIAAERSIRRPIADAPKDGSYFDVVLPNGKRIPDCRYYENELVDSSDEGIEWRYDEYQFKNSTWLPILGEGGGVIQTEILDVATLENLAFRNRTEARLAKEGLEYTTIFTPGVIGQLIQSCQLSAKLIEAVDAVITKWQKEPFNYPPAFGMLMQDLIAARGPKGVGK